MVFKNIKAQIAEIREFFKKSARIKPGAVPANSRPCPFKDYAHKGYAHFSARKCPSTIENALFITLKS